MAQAASRRESATEVAVAAAAGCTVALAYSAPSALADSGKRVRFRKSDTETIEAAGGEGGIEILVHNLSHADMAVLLTARESADGSQPMTSKARPLFNQYHFVSAAILRHIDHLTQLGMTLRPVQARAAPAAPPRLATGISRGGVQVQPVEEVEPPLLRDAAEELRTSAPSTPVAASPTDCRQASAAATAAAASTMPKPYLMLW